jgi:hypothetical protein
MINLIDTKAGYVTLILIHLFLGVMLKVYPVIVALAYPIFFLLFMVDVLYNLDSGSRAGFYALHMIGYEMIYRMAGAPFSWEMGKYASIILLLFGLFVGGRKYFPWIFAFLLVLLIPAIFFTEHPDPERLNNMIMFNISGPLSLVVAGLYFYKRGVFQDVYFHQLKWAFLPAFSIIAGLSVVANLATVEFTSVQSSFGASGGFGPNQVSTVLGWFIMLALLYKINGERITPFSWLDWGMLFYLVLRALLTFSRGGVMGSALALMGSLAVLYFSYPGFRRQLIKSMPYVFLSLAFFAGVFIFANQMTNNYLLYRYQGLSTTEALTGVRYGSASMLTGRDKIMKADYLVFLEHPGFGVGYGMGEKYRARYYGESAAAHTEFSRLLSEHGILGILFMLVGMIGLPIYFFFAEKHPLTRCFFIAFYLLSMFTMFHAAMRLALPGVLFGAAFMRVLPIKKEKTGHLESTL